MIYRLLDKKPKKKDFRIKIKTTNGEKYKFWWIEEKDDKIKSVLKTKKIFIPTKNVSYIKTTDSIPALLSLESLTIYNGGVFVKAIDNRGKLQNQKFINIELQGSVIQGIKMIGKDTVTVVIPIEQIKKVKEQNIGLSIVGSILIVSTTYIIITTALAALWL